MTTAITHDDIPAVVHSGRQLAGATPEHERAAAAAYLGSTVQLIETLLSQALAAGGTIDEITELVMAGLMGQHRQHFLDALGDPDLDDSALHRRIHDIVDRRFAELAARNSLAGPVNVVLATPHSHAADHEIVLDMPPLRVPVGHRAMRPAVVIGALLGALLGYVLMVWPAATQIAPTHISHGFSLGLGVPDPRLWFRLAIIAAFAISGGALFALLFRRQYHAEIPASSVRARLMYREEH